MILTCEIVFWACLAAVAYNYLGYPVFLFLAASISQVYADFVFLFSRKSRRAADLEAPQPRIAIIIAAFNEESVIGERVRNALAINYPGHLCEILIGLDSPTDSTAEILSEVDSPRVKIFHFSQRRGKLRVINDLVQISSAEILVFTDANTHFESDCVARMVRHFSDRRVGVVSGEEVRRTGKGVDPAAERLYWKYESALKILESRLGYLHSANGGVYAIRRALFRPQPNLIVEDFQIPIAARFLGHRVLYDPEAIAVEEIAPTLGSQFERRVRIAAGNFQTLFSNPNYLNPFKGRPAFAYWSHRVLRWLTPSMLLSAFICSVVLLHVTLYQWLLVLQSTFYLMALAGFWRRKRHESAGVYRIPLYFCTMNAALVLGFFRYLRGRQGAVWKATPRHLPGPLPSAKDSKV
jgi:cellulose synthase/poly-beta-1,6-N-acetylglucosamine synthase-like glycosyltransferase